MGDLIRAVMVQTDHYTQDTQLEECEQKMGTFVYRFRRPTNVSPLESFVRFFSDILGGVTKAKDSLCDRERTLPALINIRGQNLQITRDSSSNSIWGSISDDKQPSQAASKIQITFLRASEKQLEANKNGSTVASPSPPPPPPPPPPDISKLNANFARANNRGTGAVKKTTGPDAGKLHKVGPGSGFNVNPDVLKDRLAGLKKHDQGNSSNGNTASSTEADLAKQLAEKMASRRPAFEDKKSKAGEDETWDDIPAEVSAPSQFVKPLSPT